MHTRSGCEDCDRCVIKLDVDGERYRMRWRHSIFVRVESGEGMIIYAENTLDTNLALIARPPEILPREDEQKSFRRLWDNRSNAISHLLRSLSANRLGLLQGGVQSVCLMNWCRSRWNCSVRTLTCAWLSHKFYMHRLCHVYPHILVIRYVWGSDISALLFCEGNGLPMFMTGDFSL